MRRHQKIAVVFALTIVFYGNPCRVHGSDGEQVFPSDSNSIPPQGSDGVCSFDWSPYFEQIVRLTNRVDGGDSITIPFDQMTTDNFLGLEETWYLAKADGSGVAPFNRLVTNNFQVDHMDSPYRTDSLYEFDVNLGFAWTSSNRSGLLPIRRYRSNSFRLLQGDHRTWLFSEVPSGYVVDQTYWENSATPRLGYQRFGTGLEMGDILSDGYRYEFDNGLMRVKFNSIWGMGIGSIIHHDSGWDIVDPAIGQMVQTTLRFDSFDSPDCRQPNPTQAGGAYCNVVSEDNPNYGKTQFWTGSPVIGVTVGNPDTLPKGVQQLTSEIRPLEFCHNAQTRTQGVEPWPNTDPYSPMLWRGKFRRTDTLGCKLGNSVFDDVIRSSSSAIITGHSEVSSYKGTLGHDHWMWEDSLGSVEAGQVVAQWVNLETGEIEQIPDFRINEEYINNSPRHALVLSTLNGGFGYAVAHPNAVAHSETYFKVFLPTTPHGHMVIIPKVKHVQLSTGSWSQPIETFLVVNSRLEIFRRLAFLNADRDCLNPELEPAHLTLEQHWDGDIIEQGGTVMFPAVEIGGAAVKEFHLRNTGDLPLSVGGAYIIGREYSFLTSLPPSIAPGGSASFQVEFRPQAGGEHIATISFQTNDPDTISADIDNLYEIPFQFNANGSVAAGEIRVKQGASVVFPSQTWQYPDTMVGTPVSQAWTISNCGLGTLNVSDIAVSGAGFSLIVDPTPLSLQEGAQSSEFRIRFISNQPGTYRGTLTITSNDPEYGTFSLNLECSIEEPSPPQICVQQGASVVLPGHTWKYPDSDVGTPVSQAWTITNCGLSTLSVSAIAVSGVGFSLIVNPTPLSLQEGAQSSEFRVRLMSFQSGTYTGTVSIYSNDPNFGTFSFAVTGQVSNPDMR